MNLNLIQKLLKLSESSNDNEAALAFAKAKQLADEAGINLAIVEAQLGKEPEKEEFLNGVVECGQRFAVTQKFVNMLLPKHFNVKLIFSGSRYSGRRLHLLGRKSDVEYAIFANNFLREEFTRRWHYYQKAQNLDGKAKNAFIYGLYQGYDQKMTESLKEQVEAKLSSVLTEVKQGFQLALVSEESRREDFVKQTFPKLRTVSSAPISGLHRGDVISDGRASGRLINVNRPLNA